MLYNKIKNNLVVFLLIAILFVGVAGIAFWPQLSFAQETQFETLGLCPLDCLNQESPSLFLTGFESETQFETLGLCPLDCLNQEPQQF